MWSFVFLICVDSYCMGLGLVFVNKGCCYFWVSLWFKWWSFPFMKRIKGHWFCDNCDDVVFMSFEAYTSCNVPCPSCGHLACNFVPATLSRKVLPSEWFSAMRRVVDEAVNPELPTMAHHKKLL